MILAASLHVWQTTVFFFRSEKIKLDFSSESMLGRRFSWNIKAFFFFFFFFFLKYNNNNNKNSNHNNNCSSSSSSSIKLLQFCLALHFLWLHTPINFSIGYNAKTSKVSHLLQFYGPKSDFGGMWQPLESATDPGMFHFLFITSKTHYIARHLTKTPPVQDHKLEWPTDSL